MPTTRHRESGPDASRAHPQECRVLIETANPDLFQNNAFRITGLPTNASAREVTKHGDRLKLLEELGNAQPLISGVFAREPAPSLDEIRNALQRLKNPEKRIVDEFFWFWPTASENGRSDPALEAVQQGQADKAIEIWRGLEAESPSAIGAVHNLAVAYSMAALDRENATVGRGATEERRTKVARLWQSACKRWLKIAVKDELWDLVADRIRQLNEPNLHTGFTRQMRQSLLPVLCKVHAELGLAYLEHAQATYAQAQLSLIRQLGQETGADAIAVEMVLRPVTVRLRQQMELAQQKATADATGAVDAARELLGQARRVFSHFELLLAQNDPARSDLFDDIADTVNRIQVSYHKATGDNQGCLEILQTALPYATTLEIKERIEGNIATLSSNIAYKKLEPAYIILKSIRESHDGPVERLIIFRNKAAPLLTFVTSELTATDPARNELFDSAATVLREISIEAWNASQNLATAEAAISLAMELVHSSETRQQLLDDQNHLAGIRTNRIAAAAAKKRADEKASRNRLIGWLIAGGVVVVLVIMGSGSGSNTTPRGSPPASNYSSEGNRTYRIPRSISDELRRDRQGIESTKAAIAVLQTQVETLGSEIERERLYIDNTSQFAIDAFNRKVANYNATLERARSQNASFNQMVDSYNAKLQRYGR